MKLTKMSDEIFQYVKAAGGHVSIPELVEQTGRSARSVGANVTDLTKKGLAVREVVETEDGKITYVNLTEEGKTFVPSDED